MHIQWNSLQKYVNKPIGERIVYSINSVEKTGYLHTKNKIGHISVFSFVEKEMMGRERKEGRGRRGYKLQYCDEDCWSFTQI